MSGHLDANRSNPETLAGRVAALIMLAVAMAVAPAGSAELDGATPAELIAVLKANVYLTGDMVQRMEAQRLLESLGKQDPRAVVPLVIDELAPPRGHDKLAVHQRLALIELLRDLGPAAEVAVPRLVEILTDPNERNETVKSQAAGALGWIGDPDGKAAADAYYAGLQRDFAETAPQAETTRAAGQSAYLIRQELRAAEPADAVIAASVGQLLALGPGAAPAVPMLLRAYNDPRLGPALRDTLAQALAAAGVVDVEAEARRAAVDGAPDILAEIIADTRDEDPFVRSLAMIELGKAGATPAAVDALIAALRDGRNPGDAARVLGDFGAQAAPALPEIMRYFDDDRAGPNAIQAAGKIGVKDAAVVAALRRVLAAPGHRHRGPAASALGRLVAVEALPELTAALAVGGKYDRILAANALGRLGPSAAPAVDALAAMLDDPDVDLRKAAVTALGQIGDAAAPATAAIEDQLDAPDSRLKESARQALADIGGTGAEAALVRDAGRFADADLAEARRLGAVDGMEGVGEYLFDLPVARAVPLAHRLLSEPDPDSAFAGAVFLAHHGDVEPAIPVVADTLARRDDGEQLLTGLAYSMMHGGDDTKVQDLFTGLVRYVEQNRDRYTAEEQARLDALLNRLPAAE